MESRHNQDEDDDDCPPPLEDMTSHLTAIKSIKENQTTNKFIPPSSTNDNDEEEVRLAPKKQPV
jgi:hypothetical protein